MERHPVINAMFGCALGGIEQALLDYNDALGRAGYEVHALIHPEAKIRPALEAQGVAFHAIGNFGAWDPVAMLRVRKLLKRMNPMLSIAHGNRAASLLRRAGGVGALAVAAHNYKIDFRGASIFCPTCDLIAHARAQGVAKEAIFYVPNMVRIPPMQARRAWPDVPVIGAMGRMVAKKGFDVFVEAVALLKERGVRMRAVLAGDGEEKSALARLVAHRKLESVVTLPGWVDNASTFFDGIDLFCLPSRHEPFGIVLLEAMAQGLPVAAAAAEGPREILHDGSDGVLVPKGDAAALADALAKLLADEAAARQLGERARQHVETHYALPVVARKLDLAVRAAAGL